ncbi:LlaJI family restriction endonuclease [Congregibacter litoralis]|nr:LlaJI family restriction endonuclease [Congregibacter litoralis]
MLQDRDSLSQLDPKIAAFFLDSDLSDNGRITFCGVATFDDLVLVVAPTNSLKSVKQLELSTCDTALLLIRTLNTYTTQSENAIKEGDDFDVRSQGLGILSSILWLLKDYSHNGLYTKPAKTREINKGRVNWHRTIAKGSALKGMGGVPVYLSLHSDRLRIGSESVISQIHAEIVREIDISFGWLITGKESTRIARELDFATYSAMPHDLKIYQLKRELGQTYGDRDTALIRAMISFLESRFNGVAGEYLIGVSFFHSIWEKMLRAILPGVIDVNKILPKPSVYLEDGKSLIYTKGMLTDIVSKREGKVSVIDAKYYRATGAESVPGWPDIVKQVYYANALKLLFPRDKVFSWFAFPGLTKKKIDEGPVRQIRITNPSTGQHLDEAFPPIGCGYFCPIEVMRFYVSSQELSFDSISTIFEELVEPDSEVAN